MPGDRVERMKSVAVVDLADENVSPPGWVASRVRIDGVRPTAADHFLFHRVADGRCRHGLARNGDGIAGLGKAHWLEHQPGHDVGQWFPGDGRDRGAQEHETQIRIVAALPRRVAQRKAGNHVERFPAPDTSATIPTGRRPRMFVPVSLTGTAPTGAVGDLAIVLRGGDGNVAGQANWTGQSDLERPRIIDLGNDADRIAVSDSSGVSSRAEEFSNDGSSVVSTHECTGLWV